MAGEFGDEDTTTPTTPLDAVNLGDRDFRLMVESVSDYAIFFLDPTGHILSWNPGVRTIKGYEAHEVLGRHVSMFYPEELLERSSPGHELEVAASEGRFEDEEWRLRKDGNRFWASIVITRLSGPGGELRGFSKITRDLTDRRRRDELLRASEERFRLMVEGVKDYAIFMLDPDGRIASWNAGAELNKGYSATESIGQHFSIFYPPEALAKGWPDHELRCALRDGRFEDEGWRVRKDGTRFWASVVITALFDAEGRHRGFAKVTRDLTDRRRVSALEDEGRRVATFLAMLGHELRNPLAPIANALAVLEQPDLDPVMRSRTRDVIRRQLKQLTRLVDDLLDVGRITSGKIHLESKAVRLHDVIAQAAEAVRPIIEKKQHVLEIVVDADPWIAGDHARMLQVVSNLLNNAAKFTTPKGRIRVRLSCVGARAEISVRDDGPGIKPIDLARVFDLFAQGEQDMARSQGGLGLGLSLVQQLVTLQGGDVSAFSTGAPGDGTEFVLHMPTIAAPETAVVVDAPRMHFDAKRVLVVDDNRDAAELMALWVNALGHTATVVFDGLSALDSILADKPDVVLLDIGLPGLNGFDIARRLKHEVADPPVLIAVTGYGQDADRNSSREAGFYAHMTKPVDLDQLSILIARLFSAADHGSQ